MVGGAFIAANRPTVAKVARWSAIGIVLGPLLNVLEDRGLLGAMLNVDAAGLAQPTAWGMIALFIGIGTALAALFPHHRPRGRRWLLGICASLVLAYFIRDGLRLSAIAALFTLAYAAALLRHLERAEVRHGTPNKNGDTFDGLGTL